MVRELLGLLLVDLSSLAFSRLYHLSFNRDVLVDLVCQVKVSSEAGVKWVASSSSEGSGVFPGAC